MHGLLISDDCLFSRRFTILFYFYIIGLANFLQQEEKNNTKIHWGFLFWQRRINFSSFFYLTLLVPVQQMATSMASDSHCATCIKAIGTFSYVEYATYFVFASYNWTSTQINQTDRQRCYLLFTINYKRISMNKQKYLIIIH
jgi:hypothetical protein